MYLVPIDFGTKVKVNEKEYLFDNGGVTGFNKYAEFVFKATDGSGEIVKVEFPIGYHADSTGISLRDIITAFLQPLSRR